MLPPFSMIEGNTVKKPNLFEFATSELSQDAFICWLLSWAKPENKQVDQRLHECGTKLIDSLLEKCGKTAIGERSEVKVERQYHRMDVVCLVDKNYAILIEDKTGTENHSNQLQRYREELTGLHPECEILCIYLKTEDQSSYKDVEEADYQTFLRSDFLAILDAGASMGVDDAIFLDYRDHLQRIRDEVSSYSMLPLSEWKWRSWTGFYLELQKRLGEGNWGYVPNASGGFMGFWWYWGNGTTQYLQLECDKPSGEQTGKLCFKIEVQDKSDRREQRSKWHRLILQAAEGNALDVKRPKRFGNGRYMTVAVLKGDYRRDRPDGKIDLDSTCETLRKAQQVLHRARSMDVDA